MAPFYYKESNGIRITVRPVYLREQSEPAARHYVFAYYVRIENVGSLPAQLISRRWLIHDSIGEDTEVEGEGVVGEQPNIPPGDVHEYQSFCILKSGEGFMDFSYDEAFGGETPPAYQTLLLDVLLGDATLFTRSDEVEAAWSVIDPLLDYIAKHPPSKIPQYPAGTWGPEEADDLLEKSGTRWRD